MKKAKKVTKVFGNINDILVVKERKTKEQHYFSIKCAEILNGRIDYIDVKIVKALIEDEKRKKQKDSINNGIAKILAIIEFDRKMAEKPMVNPTITYQAIANLLASGISAEEVVYQFYEKMKWSEIKAILMGPKKDLTSESDEPMAVVLFHKYKK